MTETDNTQALAWLQAYGPSGPPKVLDLFSGIGGFSLGLERAGMQTVAFCEIEPFPRAVLAKHWPEVPCYDDVRTLTAERLVADGVGRIDVICGGFPCQDLSKAGKSKGLAGKRSGLWFEFLRLIGEIRPSFVAIENVTRLRAHGLETVLGGLDEIRYDAEWHCVPAEPFGAPDLRDRIWIIAYPQHSYTNGLGSYPAQVHVEGSPELFDQQVCVTRPILSSFSGCVARLGPDASRGWNTEPRIRRVAPRTAAGVHRSRALGNAVKPIIPEMIGRAIMSVGK